MKNKGLFFVLFCLVDKKLWENKIYNLHKFIKSNYRKLSCSLVQNHFDYLWYDIHLFAFVHFLEEGWKGKKSASNQSEVTKYQILWEAYA